MSNAKNSTVDSTVDSTVENTHDGAASPTRTRHHRAELLFCIAAWAIAVFLASQLGSQLSWQSGQPLVKQPGFFSLVAIVGMLLFGVVELFFCWRRQVLRSDESIVREVGLWLRSVEYAIWFMLYVLTVPYAGYILSTLALCLSLTLRLGYRSKPMLMYALLVGLATVVVFKSVLSVKIPGGAVYELLPDALRNFLVLYL
ncbi:MAG: tripartite tricarboxylate transporter TctB family protein [Gammaproteobacteria bacterium]|nr:tripartite tricarboxylate transporter TctB family protein [Gammaproteobacteria bacterium]